MTELEVWNKVFQIALEYSHCEGDRNRNVAWVHNGDRTCTNFIRIHCSLVGWAAINRFPKALQTKIIQEVPEAVPYIMVMI